MEMQRMNGTVQNLKEAWQKMPGKTKKMIAVIAGHEKRIQYLVYRNELG